MKMLSWSVGSEIFCRATVISLFPAYQEGLSWRSVVLCSEAPIFFAISLFLAVFGRAESAGEEGWSLS